MMACQQQVLEVTLISAKDLKRVTLFSKMRVYAVASISGGGDPRLPTRRTYADRAGGRNPVWHAPLRFTIPAPDDVALHVLLRAERRATFGGDRDVGEVLVPVRDLAAAAADGDGGGGERPRRVSYRVRRPVSGRERGVLHMSYRLTTTDVVVPASASPCPCVVRPYTHEGERRQNEGGRSAAAAEKEEERRRSPYQQQQQPHGGSPAPYGYVQGGMSATAPSSARHDGGGAGGLDIGGLGLVTRAAAGLMLGDAKVADSVGFLTMHGSI